MGMIIQNGICYSSGGGGGGEEYSTDEIEIGTWINNKKVYEKVIVINSDITISTSATTIINIPYIDTLIDGSFVSLRDNIWKKRACMLTYDQNTHDIKVRDIETQVCKPGSFMIIRYTKTT